MSDPINWRELTLEQRDALVHEKVMGRSPNTLIPAYTTHTGATWLVINRVNDNNLARENLEKLVGPGQIPNLEQICIAALRACGVEIVM